MRTCTCCAVTSSTHTHLRTHFDTDWGAQWRLFALCVFYSQTQGEDNDYFWSFSAVEAVRPRTPRFLSARRPLLHHEGEKKKVVFIYWAVHKVNFLTITWPVLSHCWAFMGHKHSKCDQVVRPRAVKWFNLCQNINKLQTLDSIIALRNWLFWKSPAPGDWQWNALIDRRSWTF